jgi:hypothetical protein
MEIHRCEFAFHLDTEQYIEINLLFVEAKMQLLETDLLFAPLKSEFIESNSDFIEMKSEFDSMKFANNSIYCSKKPPLSL